MIPLEPDCDRLERARRLGNIIGAAAFGFLAGILFATVMVFGW